MIMIFLTINDVYFRIETPLLKVGHKSCRSGDTSARHKHEGESKVKGEGGSYEILFCFFPKYLHFLEYNKVIWG